LPGQVEGLLEDLHLHGLAARQAPELAHAPLEVADPRRADDVLVGGDGLKAALEHAALPAEKLAGRDAVRAGDVGDGHAGPRRLLDEADLLGGGPARRRWTEVTTSTRCGP
jgi:hypothetical protein